jgi:hypothetical protein
VIISINLRRNGCHTDKFQMNSLISKEYETLPIEGDAGARMPGYTGHVPGAKFASVYGQRKAAATKHEAELRPLINATGGAWQDMQMMDLQPQMRSYNKEYIYAENLPAKYGTPSSFLMFASDNQFDHRRM